jgi:hypothetical protein
MPIEIKVLLIEIDIALPSSFFVHPSMRSWLVG